jgi:hypothetical protein
MKRYIIFSTLFVAISMPVVAGQTLMNCLRLTKALVAQGPQRGSGNGENPPVTLTALAPLPLLISAQMAWNCSSSTATPVQGAFVPSATSVNNLYSSTACSCSAPLTSINVGITDANNTCILSCQIGSATLGDYRIARLIQNDGLYVGVNLFTVTSGPAASTTSQNVVQVVLMDEYGMIYAQNSYLVAAGVGLFDHYNVGFNVVGSTVANGTTSVGINGIRLNQALYYKQQSKAVTAKPSGASMSLEKNHMQYLKAGCVPVSGTFTPSMASMVNVYPSVSSCVQELDYIYVFVADAQETCPLSFYFSHYYVDTDKIKSLYDNEGLYVGVNVLQGGQIQAVLMDQSGMIWAQGIYPLSPGVASPDHYNVVFGNGNGNGNGNASGNVTVKVNNVPLTQVVPYLQQLSN